MRKWLYILILSAVALTLVLRVGDRIARRATLPARPQPNGYEVILQVAREITPPTRELEELGNDELARIAESNRPALKRLHEAVRAETGVPLSTAKDWQDQHGDDLKSLKRLALALAIQSRADLLQGNTNAAAASLVDVILLAHAMARGGIVVDGINSLVVETLGAGTLRSLLPQLDAAACREAASALEHAEPRREPPERILQTEAAWAAASFGLGGKLVGWFSRSAQAKRQEEFTRRSTDILKRTRRLTLLLAARALELETGRKPGNPSDLVPGILRKVPVDPETHQPFTQLPGPQDPAAK